MNDDWRTRIDAIVIGGSAGGVDALLDLVPAFSADYSRAIIVVVHLPRDTPSYLPGALRPRCALPISEAEDKEPVVPGRIYFAPPDYHLLIDAGPCLALSADEPVFFSRPSIDVLFESAADIYGDRLMGVVLSGANEDGARGLARIHEAGGVTVVQDPKTAQVASMPASAMKLTPIDFALSPGKIGELLASLESKGRDHV